MSVPEFEALQHLLKDSFSADRIAAARLVMLDGYSNQEAADQFGVTRQAVWKTVQRMRDTLDRYK
ncbi:MAG: helix-turn-helix domain-containing protein, partial [Rhodoferax sp.]